MKTSNLTPPKALPKRFALPVIPLLVASFFLLSSLPKSHSAVLIPSDSDAGDFGFSVGASGVSGTMGLVGAETYEGAHHHQGAAYLYRNLTTATGTVTETVKLLASDAAENDLFGASVSLSGNMGVIGAFGKGNSGNKEGMVYLFRGLNTAAAGSTVSENAKLVASDGTAGDRFGISVSLSGNNALVGAEGQAGHTGAAYFYSGLNSIAEGGVATEAAKLVASDGAAGDSFGNAASLSGTAAVIGAEFKAGGGSAYLYRELDAASGTVTETARLTASDKTGGDRFGSSVSIADNMAIIGAENKSNGQGAAYLYRELDGIVAGTTVSETAKLVASDGLNNGSMFGVSVSVSGSTGLVGAQGKDAAYLYLGLDSATGTVSETVKLTASNGTGSAFGSSVSVDGDSFVIGAVGSNEAYSGSVSSITTLDAGYADFTISGISFVSQTDWIIGQNSSANTVTLAANNTANVSASGREVYIGQNAGSNNNTLVIQGTVITDSINIGSESGNTGNSLQLDSSAIFGDITFNLAEGNFLYLEGDYFTSIDSLFDYFADHSSILREWSSEHDWMTVTESNYGNYISVSYNDGTNYTQIEVVPEPSIALLTGLGLCVVLFLRRRAGWSARA